MGISTAILPDSSPAIPFAYEVALAIVNPALAFSPPIYALAVYNLGGSNIVNFANDVPNAPPVDGTDPPIPFFEALRKKWQITSFVSGVIQSANDQGTGDSFVVPKPAEDFTLADLQYLKDPWGRQYLAFAQRYGTLWGIS